MTTLCASVLLADSLTEDIYNAVAPRYQANPLYSGITYWHNHNNFFFQTNLPYQLER